MVIKQGDIIKFNFNPTLGSEQSGYRPALVVSNEVYNVNTGFLIVLPITSTNNEFPLHIPLDSRTKTNGYILCEHIKSIDRNARKVRYIESLPKDILEHIIKIIEAEIRIVND